MLEYAAVLFTLSLALLLFSLFCIPLIVIKLPADYFSHESRHKTVSPHSPRSSLIQLLLRAIRNVLGALLVLAGIAMLVLPGQGIITILAGLGLMNFPGKYQIEQKIIRIPSVLRTANWIRERQGKEKFQV